MELRKEWKVFQEWIVLSARYAWAWGTGTVAGIFWLLGLYKAFDAAIEWAAGFVALGVLVSLYQSFRKVKLENDAFNAVQRARPRIVVVECYKDRRAVSRTEKHIIPIECIHVRFRNAPLHNPREAKAEDVVARVSWFRGSELVLEHDGRWGDTEQPTSDSPSVHLNQAEFGIGITRELNLAVRRVYATEYFYAFNNESYEYVGWERSDRLLRAGTYRVSIRLWGTSVDVTHEFEVSLDEEGFEIRHLPSPDPEGERA